MMTDDDLLYDPNMDDDDQTWVDDVRSVMNDELWRMTEIDCR